LIVILGVTDSRSPSGFAGVAIGLTLNLIHLIRIPLTNTSVNPATLNQSGSLFRKSVSIASTVGIYCGSRCRSYYSSLCLQSNDMEKGEPLNLT
jgi:hypothetical protein